MGMAINCHEKLQHLEFASVSLVVLNRNTERVAELPALGRICSIAPYCWFPIWIATKVMVTQALPWAIGWCIAVSMGNLRSPFLTLPTTACCFLAASVVYIFSATHGFIATRLVKSKNEMISCDSIEFLDFLETLSPFWPKRCLAIVDPTLAYHRAYRSLRWTLL